MSKLAPSTKKKIVIQERDGDIFRLIWRLKIMTTHAIIRKFFRDSEKYTTDSKHEAGYNRLMRLQRAGYVQRVTITEGEFGWILTPKSYQLIRETLPHISNDGFKSEYKLHDFIASAFQFGEWLTGNPAGALAVSEQQLRRFPEDNWPDWIPRTPMGTKRKEWHRPDGLSKFIYGGNEVVAAFEYERTVKEASRYKSVVSYYNNTPTVTYVFWLVDTQNMVNKLLTICKMHGLQDLSRHNFVQLSELREKGWRAQFSAGILEGKSLLEVLGSTGVDSGLQKGLLSNTLCLLNSCINPKIPKVLTETSIRPKP